MKTKSIRFYRITKHFIMYHLTLNIEHKYEVSHYRYMVEFRNDRIKKGFIR